MGNKIKKFHIVNRPKKDEVEEYNTKVCLTMAVIAFFLFAIVVFILSRGKFNYRYVFYKDFIAVPVSLGILSLSLLLEKFYKLPMYLRVFFVLVNALLLCVSAKYVLDLITTTNNIFACINFSILFTISMFYIDRYGYINEGTRLYKLFQKLTIID